MLQREKRLNDWALRQVHTARSERWGRNRPRSGWRAGEPERAVPWRSREGRVSGKGSDDHVHAPEERSQRWLGTRPALRRSLVTWTRAVVVSRGRTKLERTWLKRKWRRRVTNNSEFRTGQWSPNFLVLRPLYALKETGSWRAFLYLGYVFQYLAY